MDIYTKEELQTLEPVKGEKATNRTLVKVGSRKNTRVFLQFKGIRLDEVVVKYIVRGCLTEEENKGVI